MPGADSDQSGWSFRRIPDSCSDGVRSRAFGGRVAADVGRQRSPGFTSFSLVVCNWFFVVAIPERSGRRVFDSGAGGAATRLRVRSGGRSARGDEVWRNRLIGDGLVPVGDRQLGRCEGRVNDLCRPGPDHYQEVRPVTPSHQARPRGHSVGNPDDPLERSGTWGSPLVHI